MSQGRGFPSAKTGGIWSLKPCAVLHGRLHTPRVQTKAVERPSSAVFPSSHGTSAASARALRSDNSKTIALGA